MARELPILFNTDMVRAIMGGRKTNTRRPVTPQPSEDWRPRVERFHPTVVDRRGDERPGAEVFGASDEDCGRVSPYAPGDLLYVRETFAVSLHDPDCAFTPSLADRDAWDDLVIYRADDTYGEWTREDAYGERVSVPTPWRPSIHMPKWAARTWLRVTSVRVERVQDISGDDARAEGVRYPVSAEGCPEGKCSPLLAIDVMERAIQWGILGTLKVPAARLPTHDDLSRLYFAQLWDSVYGNWDANPWVWVYAFEKVTP